MTDIMEIPKEAIDNAFDYESYREALDEMLNGNNSTIFYEDESLIDYTRLNVSRMQRWDKTTRLSDHVCKAARKLNRSVIWLLLTEGWCGDAAHCVPIINEIASESPNIELKLLLRDNNLNLMDQFLTNGSRSIPKLIVLDAHTMDVVHQWGPRPQVLQDEITNFEVAANGDRGAFNNSIQKWYNKDKGKHLMKEFTVMLEEINR